MPKTFLFFLCEPPFEHESPEQVVEIAESALKKGHKVNIFMMMDGVYNPVKYQNGVPFNMTSVSDRFKNLLRQGAKIVCCRVCMELRGVNEAMYPEGIVAGGIFDLSEMIAESDIVLSFTGR